ncbi:MAG TPA: adenylate kinase [Candidatus Rubrimentiphilum sp.]|nr:adenylate kinase [Candidatus Rubrimentiphilum sp.]
MRLIFLGPPGAGKGTQSRLLTKRFGARHISTGDILREHRVAGTELGGLAEGFMSRGELLPDELILKMIEGEIDRSPRGFIMDGFPRTVAQAEAFDALMERTGVHLDGVVLFDVDRDTLVTRLTSRWTNPLTGRSYNAITNPPPGPGMRDEDGTELIQREDDKAETVRKRLDVYQEQTEPLVTYYRKRGKLVKVDGLAPVEDVTRQIVSALSPELQAS